MVFAHRLPTTKAETFVLSYRYDFCMTGHDDISIFFSALPLIAFAPHAQSYAGWEVRQNGNGNPLVVTARPY